MCSGIVYVQFDTLHRCLWYPLQSLIICHCISAAHRGNSNRYKAPVDDSCEESSIFSSDLDTTSVADSEDDRKSRFMIHSFPMHELPAGGGRVGRAEVVPANVNV